MTLKDKAEQTIKKLIALTQDNHIEWQRFYETRTLTHGTDEIVDIAYSTLYKNSKFVIYESKYRTMDEDEHVYWDNRIVVDLFDIDGTLIWNLPRVSAMWDLLETVRVRTEGVEERLDDFLSD